MRRPSLGKGWTAVADRNAVRGCAPAVPLSPRQTQHRAVPFSPVCNIRPCGITAPRSRNRRHPSCPPRFLALPPSRAPGCRPSTSSPPRKVFQRSHFKASSRLPPRSRSSPQPASSSTVTTLRPKSPSYPAVDPGTSPTRPAPWEKGCSPPLSAETSSRARRRSKSFRPSMLAQASKGPFSS